MKARRRKSLCGAMAVGLAGILPITLSAATPQSSEPKLEVSLRLDKSQFEVGEPIPVTVEIVNHGDAEYAVQSSTEETGALDGCAFAVTDAAGKAVPAPRTLPRAGNWIGAWYTITRHEKHERKVFLNYWIMPPDPGRYRVQGVYSPPSLAVGQRGVRPALRTASVEFEILPTTSTKLDVRLSRLTDQSDKGDSLAVDFLGFTGAWQATEPLLEALYHEDAVVARHAANALNYLPDQKSVLEAGLGKLKSRGSAGMLVEWLHFRGAPAATLLPVYLSNIGAEEPGARAGAVTGLRLAHGSAEANGKFKSAIRAALLRALVDRDVRVRLEAAQALGLDDDVDAAATLLAATRKDATARVRRQAALSLNDMRSEPAIPSVRELLLVDFRLRPNFAEQLREIGSPQARGVLREGLKSVNPQVRDECAKQLWLLKDAVGKETLVEVLRTGSVDSQSEIVRFLQDSARASDTPTRGPDSTARTWADWLEKQK